MVTYGQNQRIAGTVKDYLGLPISNVRVEIEKLNINVFTDSLGHFQISAPNGTFLIQLRHIGFEKDRKSVV